MKKLHLFRMKVLFISILLLIHGLGCKGQISPSNNIILKSDIILEDELGLWVYSVGPYLLVKQDQKVKDGEVFHVYKEKNLEFLKGIGVRGKQSPHSFYGVTYAGQSSFENGQWNIWVNDPPRFRISKLNIDRNLLETEPVLEQTISHDPNLDLMSALYVMDDKTLIGRQPGYRFGTNKHPVVIVKNDEIREYGEYPEIEGKEDERFNLMHANIFNKSIMSINGNNSKIVLAHRHYDEIFVYSSDGTILETRVDEEVQYKVRFGNDQKLDLSGLKDFYVDVIVNKDKIYALSNNGGDGKSIQTIRVFNWSLELINEFRLDVPVSSVAISADGKRLYAGSYESQKLYRFRIPQ